MVTDKHNKIYTELMDYLKTIYPNIKGGTVYKEGEKSLPFVYFFQIDGSTALTTLSNTEDGINLAFQIEVYTDTGMNMARKIATSIREYMIEGGFICRVFMPVNQPTTVSRFVTRFIRLDV